MTAVRTPRSRSSSNWTICCDLSSRTPWSLSLCTFHIIHDNKGEIEPIKPIITTLHTSMEIQHNKHKSSHRFQKPHSWRTRELQVDEQYSWNVQVWEQQRKEKKKKKREMEQEQHWWYDIQQRLARSQARHVTMIFHNTNYIKILEAKSNLESVQTTDRRGKDIGHISLQQVRQTQLADETDMNKFWGLILNQFL